MMIFNLAAALSTISYDHNNTNNNAPEKEQIVLNRLFEIINKVNELVDRTEQVQRSQAWTFQQISKLIDEVKQLKKGVLQQQ